MTEIKAIITKREMEILNLLSRGMSSNEIAAKLFNRIIPWTFIAVNLCRRLALKTLPTSLAMLLDWAFCLNNN